MPIGKIVDFLEEYKEYNFIDCLVVKAFEKRNDIYFPDILIGRKIWQKILKNVLIYITGGWNHTFSIIKRLAPNGVGYYFGSSWWCLNRETVEWIKAYLYANPSYVNFFKNSLCPDECFFQTLVMNSPYSKNVKPCLHYVQWEEGKSSPKILTIHDLNNMIQSGKMMGRKFDIEIDKTIMQELDNI